MACVASAMMFEVRDRTTPTFCYVGAGCHETYTYADTVMVLFPGTLRSGRRSIRRSIRFTPCCANSASRDRAASRTPFPHSISPLSHPCTRIPHPILFHITSNCRPPSTSTTITRALVSLGSVVDAALEPMLFLHRMSISTILLGLCDASGLGYAGSKSMLGLDAGHGLGHGYGQPKNFFVSLTVLILTRPFH
ncbi:hypothetical protein JAAARDRAFT_628103 [Jaapia argillacea MUCL 33604]|uniref:Uncharacterized protein n=1 Tax=Jaapia argillacea MUCL 33604 TaxID=933084 RepID=A0A067PXU2_9AGAM|nr:hypothetical protein JAAARDRAFT_628103 [Jaapia argillacea MUCL 33604]